MSEKKELSNWAKLLMREKDSEDFSMLVHSYYKLAMMRVMQSIRAKYEVPNDELHTLILGICSRMLNEAVYSVGASLKDGFSIKEVYHKQHLLNLVRVLNGEELSQSERTDIDVQIESGLRKFKEFILEKGEEFRL